jgi:hypothetical protein
MNIQGLEYLSQPTAALFAGSLGDVAIPLIIVIVIIVNVIRGFSKFSQSRPGTGQAEPQTDSPSPDEQIRDFLESLSGETKHQAKHEQQSVLPPPVPQPVARPVPHQAPPRQTSFQSSSAPRITATAVTPVTTLETNIQHIVVPALDLRKPVKAAMTVQRPSFRTSLMRKLASGDSLRETILLREILGPPLALRRQMMRQFQE